MKKASANTLDYTKIGERIRRYRNACRLTQEQLAEAIDISVSHLSHIETANTKLSLAALVKISEVLSVPTDELLFDAPNNQTAINNNINDILTDCSTEDLLVFYDIISSSAAALKKYHS